MKAAEDYLSEVTALIAKYDERISREFDSAAEARQGISDVVLMQKELRLIKSDLNLTLQQIRSSYTTQKANVKAGFFSSFMGKKSAGHDRAVKKESLRVQQENTISPYQMVAAHIDKALIKLDEIKVELNKLIAEQDSESKQASG